MRDAAAAVVYRSQRNGEPTFNHYSQFDHLNNKSVDRLRALAECDPPTNPANIDMKIEIN